MSSAIYSLLEILSMMICLSYLYGKRFKLDFPTVIVISLDVILMQAILYFGLPRMVSALIYPIIMIYCGFEYGFKIKEIIVNNILYMIILAGLQYVFILLYLIISKVEYMNPMGFVIVNAIILLVFVMVLRKCHLEKISLYLQKEERLLIISIFLCIAIMLYCMFRMKRDNGMYMITYAFLVASGVMISLLASNLGKYKIKAAKAETELKVHQLYADSFQTLLDNIRLRQHEFDNHINSIYSQHYIYKTYDELVKVQREYCEVLEKDNRYNKLLTSGNSVLIGFLYGKFMEIEKQGINIAYQVNVQKLICGVPIYKIIEILGDLINNAVDALKAAKGQDQLFVSVIETADQIELEVRNESAFIRYEEIRSFFTKGYSKKGKNRGLGLYNVKQICEEYHLDIICENKNIDGNNWLSFMIKIVKETLATQ
ncbi:MAG: GHKL domain-containing protein [Lachnospiraceae bacterium]|nr:GHKL domain-containing protein [Lachnospiraceae bacterium]